MWADRPAPAAGHAVARDQPALMNAVANALFGLSALLILTALAVRAATHLPVFDLRELVVVGELNHVTRDQIEDVARREIRGNFFTTRLASTRAALERLPWVRNAQIRRQWPARLEVTLEEHRPFARWGGNGLVNTHGEVFHAAYEGALPVFHGPDGAAREMTIQYRYFQKVLGAIGRAPVEIHLNARRAWQIRLDTGLTLALGRDSIETRIARFVALHDRTIGRLGDRRIDYVDLRYPDGFSVRMPGGGSDTVPRPGSRRRTEG